MSSKPVYWLNESSGTMKEIVNKFLQDIPLCKEELKLLRWYIWQWVAAPLFVKPPGFSKELIYSLSQEQLWVYIVTVLEPQGIDPF